jgi:putative membrane protein
MLSYNPKDWFSIIFFIRKSDTVRTLLPAMAALGTLVAVFCFVEIELVNLAFTSTVTMHSLLGFVISMLLVFRTNTAYERWWEGRKQWGALVNVSRNLAIRISQTVPEQEVELRQYFRVLISNYAFALKEHLRSPSEITELEAHPLLDLDALRAKAHVPNAMAQKMYEAVLQLRKENRISEEQLFALDGMVHQFTDITGACERIRKTPIPYSYSAFIKKFIFLYVISLPFGIIADFGYASILVTVAVFYVLASLELIAEEIEDPFGTDTNDLPTDEISITIRANLKEML